MFHDADLHAQPWGPVHQLSLIREANVGSPVLGRAMASDDGALTEGTLHSRPRRALNASSNIASGDLG